MNVVREHLYLVTLPSGRILAVGGAVNTRPDLFDPYAQTWLTAGLATMTIGRGYHASAVLLVDGSVFVAGGEGGEGEPPEQRSYQIYKPPYFFGATRPVISSAPATIYYGNSFTITTTSNPQDITVVRLARLGAATHSFDQDARMLELKILQRGSDWVRVRPPANGNVGPPGYYMLFIAKGDNGSLPSTGVFVQLRAPVSN